MMTLMASIGSGIMDVIELNTEVSMIELDVKKDWIGKTLMDLNLRKKYSINVIAIKENEKIEIDIDPKTPLTEKMKLVVIGKTAKLSKIK